MEVRSSEGLGRMCAEVTFRSDSVPDALWKRRALFVKLVKRLLDLLEFESWQFPRRHLLQ